jgi:hypothetical protein
MRAMHWFAATFVLMALSVAQRNGSYAPWALCWMLAAFAMACVGAWRVHRGDDEPPSERFLAICLIGVAFVALDVSPLIHDKKILVDRVAHALQLLLIAWAAAAYVYPSGLPDRLNRILGVGFVAIALIARLAAPFLSPSPVIDVFYAARDGSVHLLDGLNPYLTPITDPYDDGAGFGYEIDGYFYLPAALYLQTVGHLLGDVRFASVLAECAFVAVMWRLTRGKAFGLRIVPLLLFLWHPKGFLVIEQAWTEPLILGCLALFLWLEARGSRLAPAVFGYLLSIKQTTAFWLIHWFRLRPPWNGVSAAIAVLVTTMLPFSIWDAASFWEYAVLFQLQTAFRPDALTVFAPLSKLGLIPSKGWTIGLGLIATLVSMRLFRALEPMRAWLLGMTLSTFAMFLFGSQAFCNYYYLAWGLLTIILVQPERQSKQSLERK